MEPFLLVIVRILMLAACLPLLLPTGFCLCKLGLEPHSTPPHAGDSTSDREDPLAPDDDSHTPGCPASHGADQLKWIEPLEFSAQVPPPVEVLVLVPFLLETTTLTPREHEGP